MLSPLPQNFVAIVDCGSITAAADRLGLAKSAVSQNLKRLEVQIGVKLATRTTRRLTPTPAGERYYRRCKELLALSRVARSEMEDYGAEPSGPLSITAPHTMIGPLIAPALSRLVSAFPNLRPIVIADDKRLDLIETGIDMAISVGELPDSNLKVRKVGILRNVLCASPSLVELSKLGGKTLTISDIRSLPYIAHTRETPKVSHVMANNTGKRTVKLKFQYSTQCNTVDGVHGIARQGLGCAVLPEFTIADDLEAGRLVRLLPSYSIEPKPIYAVHGYDTMPPKSLLAFTNFVADELPQ